jgi:hypothetical protein
MIKKYSKNDRSMLVNMPATGIERNEVPACPPSKISKTEVEEYYRRLEFDPNGNSEGLTALLNPKKALAAAIAARIALDETDKHFPTETGLGDKKDAFRHALWSYRLTKMIGPEGAKVVTDAHERDDGPWTGERLQDLYNNKIGRELALDNNSKGTPEATILNALQSGMLMTNVPDISQ